MPLPNEDTITDEELDAELERVQQKITLTLQTIDQNFERCNQIVTGRIIPEIDKFTQSSRDLWERSKLWLYFFQLHGYGTPDEGTEQTQHTTNRPPVNYDPTRFPPSAISATWKRLYEDLDRTRAAATGINTTVVHSSMATGLFSPPRTTTDSVKGMLRPGGHHRILSPAELTTTGQNNSNHHRTVAQNIQQQLQGLNQLQAIQSDSETSTGSGLFGTKSRHHLGNSPMSSISSLSNELNQAETPARTPMIQRQDDGTMSFVFGNTTYPPAQMTTETPVDEREQIVANYYDNLKQSRSKRAKLNYSYDNIPSQQDNVQEGSSKETRHDQEDVRMSDDESAPLAPSSPPNNNNDLDLAIEFSPMAVRHHHQPEEGTPHSQQSSLISATTNSMISMISGIDGRIPARFSLSYFPETFWHPPGSTKLTRMYTLFSDRPGQCLSLDQIVDLLNAQGASDQVTSYMRDSSKPILDILVHKRFLRRMDKGWILRS